jgi:ketosteroid isomerase-like protein
MNKKKLLFIAALGTLSCLNQALQAQTAKVQAIHNSPHPTASSVDVWVTSALGTTKLLSNFAFREATPFVDVPAGIPVTVAIALPGSSTITDTVAGLSITATLADGERYLLLAQGNVSGTGYAANPNGIPNGFAFLPVGGIRAAASGSGNVDFLVVHGSPDAPGVDIYAKGITTPLISDLRYNAASSYLSVSADRYVLNITVAGSSDVVFSKVADVAALAGNSFAVFASGYLSPAANDDGPAFGVFAALEDGTVIELPDAKARVQVVHNSADAGAALVDVYYNGQKLLDDFAFRKATGFVDVDAEKSIQIGIAPPSSSGAADTLVNFTYQLDEGGKYLLVANGVLNPAAYAANPDSRSIGFNILVYPMAREVSTDPTKTDLLVLHGATDAPTVDVLTGGNLIVDNLAYGDFQGYLSVDPQPYILALTPGNDNSNVLLRYRADLSNLGGGAATLMASGFLNPMANQNGSAFELLAVFADGTVASLPLYEPKARIQVIHNAADTNARSVDVYYNGTRLIDNFGFRKASTFVDVDAESEIHIGIAPPNSTSASDTLVNFRFTLADGGKYVVVANGVLNPTTFAANPDGKATGFNLFVYPAAREVANDAAKVDLLVFHGATDVPAVDVQTGGSVIVNDISYGDFQGYLSVDPLNYNLEITPANDNQSVLLTFVASLNGLGGNAVTLFASGFLSPAGNNNGPGFALMAALADGTVIELPLAASNVQRFRNVEARVYPNPANHTFSVQTREFNKADYQIRNISGQVISSGVWTGNSSLISVKDLPAGVYLLEMLSGERVFRSSLMVQH